MNTRSRRAIKRHLLELHRCCYHCGRPLDRIDGAVLDHFVPRSRGGGDGIANAVLSCRRCDRRKRDRMPSVAEYRWWLRSGRLIGRSLRAIAAVEVGMEVAQC